MNFRFLASGEFYSLACAIVWAIAILLFRKSGERVAPLALNAFKNGAALCLFLVSLPILGVPLLAPQSSTRDWIMLLASGAIGIGIADTLFFASLNRLGATNSAIVDCLYSPFVILFAFFYLGEPIRLPLLAAVALMVGAILVGTWEPRRATSAERRRQLGVGIALGIVAMVFMAMGIVLAKPVLATSNAWWATTVRLMGGEVLLIVQAIHPRYRRDVLACMRPSRAWLFTLPGAFIGAYVALILWILGMKHTYASTASVLNQTSTIFVMVFAFLFLKERITLRKVAAIMMAFGGAAIAVI